MRKPKRMHPTQGREPLATRADEVLHSVQRPVHVDRHYTPPARVDGGGALETRSRSGKPGQPGGTDTELGASGRCAARGVSPLSQGSLRGTSQKEGGCGLRPCEDSGPRLGCPHVVETLLQKSVGGIWPRISSAHALQKERSGSSERGPSRSGRRRDERRRARRAKGWPRVGLHRPNGARPAKAQGGVRTSLSGRDIAKSGVAVAGPGL
jgi:hypothetical protein